MKPARKRRIAGLALALAAAALASCGGGGSSGGVNPPTPLNVRADPLDDGVAGSVYSDAVTTSGGRAPVTFALTGDLPAGLTLAANGTISGTPAGPAGTSNFSVTATDNAAQTDSQDFAIRIADPVTADVGSPPLAIIGQPYSHSVTASGGTPPYEFLASLPSGLTIDADGLISGTPDADAVTSTADLGILDSATPQQNVTFALHVPVRLEVATTALPDAFGGVAYSATLQAQGGLPGLQWQKTGGDLAFAVSIDGRVTGTATASCTPAHRTLDVGVEDFDTPAQTAQRTGITLDIVPRDVQIPATSAPPVGAAGVAYEHEILVSPGVPPYAFTVASGTLPSGIALGAATGILTGTPTTGGTSNFTIRVTDDCGSTATASFSIIVRGPPTGRNDTIATATPIGNGVLTASISPSGHPNSVFAPDEDYYRVQTTAASTVTVDLEGQGGGIDTVIEIVDASGTRLSLCGAPAYTDDCVSDDESPGVLDSFLKVRVPGPTTFYIHVAEWRGDGRPDLRYGMDVSGVN